MLSLGKASKIGVMAALAVVGLMLAASSARADLQVSVGNPGLQHFDSGAVGLDFGVSGGGGGPVGNLTPANVKVFEDGAEAQILDFRGVGQGRPVDIVFVMDVTESMQPYIDAVKTSMQAFARDLAANHRDYRLGLVTFEDYVISAYADCNCAYRDKMTSNVAEFEQWVGSLHAGGGGDIPEDQLDALAYAARFPFRPNAQAILILITDAPCHQAGDGPDLEGDPAYREHHPGNNDVTDLTGDKVAAIMERQGLTLYAVAPPPFIAPQYAEIVKATHGQSWNIVTEEGRFTELVKQIGHSIATQYSLSYRSPRPIEDGTTRKVVLRIDFGGQQGAGETAYRVRGVGGAAYVPPPGAAAAGGGEGAGLAQLSFRWWNLGVPLLAVLCLFGLSRVHLGISTEELNAIVRAQANAAGGPPAGARAAVRAPQQAAAAEPAQVRTFAPLAAGEARLLTINPVAPIAAEYSLLKDEISLGRGETNDIVIPHPSVSRAHARLLRRDGAYEFTDLNSTNGSYVNERQIKGSTMVANGSELRLGDVRFVLRF